MKAARLHQFGQPPSIDEVPIPEIGEEDVLVRVKAAGLNGGDPHFIKQDIRLRPDARDATPMRALPITMGHAAAGVIAKVGSQVRGVKDGDRVRMDGSIKCGKCHYCRTDQELLCEGLGIMGFVHLPLTEEGRDLAERYREGCFAEYVKVPGANVHRLPDEIPFDQASQLGLLAVGYRATKKARVRPGETVIVNAASGGAGVCAILSARLFGAARVIAVARDEGRLRRVKELIDPKAIEAVTTGDDIQARVLALTDGKGADVLIDYVPRGVESTVQCIYSLRNGGRAVLVGGCTEELKVGYRFLMMKEIELTASKGYASYEIPELMNLITRGKLDISRLVTHRFPLGEINHALEVLERRMGDPIWVVLEP